MKELFRAKSKLINQINSPDRAEILIIGLGILMRVPQIFYSSEIWKPEDTASIAHFF
jgi:hypothetical protein